MATLDPKCRIIAIAGLSGCGKTTLARRLANRLGAPILSTDDYYLPLTEFTFAERLEMNFDAPEMIDFDLLAEHLERLSRGEAIDKPIYDFVEFTRKPEIESFPAPPWVILEGQYALYSPEANQLMTSRIFLDVEPNICLARRTERDVRERGRTPEEVHWRFHSHVLPMFRRFIAPTANVATLQLESPFTPHEAESAVLESLEGNLTTAS